MKIVVGDLVTCPHWGTGYIGLVVAIEKMDNEEYPHHFVVYRIMMNDGTIIQEVSGLEKICE